MQHNIDNVMSYKDFLKMFATDEETIAKINALADGDCFIHGDFHLENVMLDPNDQLVLIDMMNVCKGTELYDVARTYFLLSYDSNIQRKYLEKMGITTLNKNDETLALALGGLDKGISPLEMAGAYSTIANDGEYIEPTFYTEIERNNGKKLIKSKQKKKRVFSKEVAYVLKKLLTQAKRVQGKKYVVAFACKKSGTD